jgi:hypothetical protein
MGDQGEHDQGERDQGEQDQGDQEQGGAPEFSRQQGTTIRQIIGDAQREGMDLLIVAILSTESFVAGVRAMVDEHLEETLGNRIFGILNAPRDGDADAAAIAEPPVSIADQVAAGVAAYLDEHLPELVEAAMPETPDKAAKRQAADAAEAVVKRERADRKAAREQEKSAEAAAADRAKLVVASREARASLISGEGSADAEPIDLATIRGGKLWLDDGVHFAIDFGRLVGPGQLEQVDGGPALLLRSPAIDIGEAMAERFTIEAVVLLLEGEEGHRVLRCALPSPVLVGGGAKAQLGADSLLFRPI